MDNYKEYIRTEAINKLKGIGIQTKGTESLDELQDLLSSHLTPREYDDFLWDIQMYILDQNGSPP